jgi:hypothetical protein
MLYAVLIAVCATATPIHACDSASAVHWFAAPDAQLMSGCGTHGQQYAAQSRLAGEGTYVKIFCRPLAQRAEAVRQ